MNLFCVANSFTRLLDGLVPRTIRIAASQQIHGPSTNYTCGGTDRLTLLSTFNCPSRSDICMSLRATETVACMHLSSTAHRACTPSVPGKVSHRHFCKKGLHISPTKPIVLIVFSASSLSSTAAPPLSRTPARRPPWLSRALLLPHASSRSIPPNFPGPNFPAPSSQSSLPRLHPLPYLNVHFFLPQFGCLSVLRRFSSRRLDPPPRIRFGAAALDLEGMGTREAMRWCCGAVCDEVDKDSTFFLHVRRRRGSEWW
jgi:hypothetical protein